MESDDRQHHQQRQQQHSPPPSLSPLLGQPEALLSPAGLQAAVLAQLTAQHASQLQYQQALLTWARLVTAAALPPPPPLLADPAEVAARTAPAAAPSGGGSSLASSESPPRSDGSPPPRPARKPPAREKVFPCPICHRLFGYKHVLQNHVRTHTGEKPFQCTECHKRFTRDHHLKTHMRLHTGEKPYQCQHCARRFVQVANLRRHLRVHTGERPHACRHCSARFSDTNQLKNHQLVHTDHRPFGCTRCGITFKRQYQLAQHSCVAAQVGLPAAVAEEAQRLGRRLSEKLRLERAAAALGTGMELTVKTEQQPELEVKEAGPVIGQAFSLRAGLGEALLPDDSSSQTEPEDLSVPASRWSSSSLDERRHSSASLLSLAGGTATEHSPETDERSSHQRRPSGSAEHARYDGAAGDSQRRGQHNGEFVPWWDLKGRQSPKSGSESESRKLSTSPQRLPASPWPLHPGQPDQVTVFPERQQISVRRWDQLATTGSDRPEVIQTVPDKSPAQQTVDRADSPRRRDDREARTADHRSWPWSLSLNDTRRGLPAKGADTHRGLPEKDRREERRQDTSVSSPDVLVIDCVSSDEEEEKPQQSATDAPPRCPPVSDAGGRADPDGGRGRRVPPSLVPLWAPPQSSAPRPAQEDGQRTAGEDTGSALRTLLAAPSSPPPAEYPWSQRRASSQGYGAKAELCGVAEKEQHREEREDHHRLDMKSDYSWDTKEDKRHWEHGDQKYFLNDSVEIKLWGGVKG